MQHKRIHNAENTHRFTYNIQIIKKITDMKKIFAALLLVSAILTALPSYAQNDETLKSKSYKFSSLSGIEAGSVFQITVQKGRSGKVTVYAPAKTLDHVIVSESGGVLRLRIENGYNVGNGKKRWFSSSKDLEGPIKVAVEMPSLAKIELSGAATLHSKETFSEKNCEIELSGASKVRLGEVNANVLDLNMSGASELVLAGSYDIIKTDLSGATKTFLSSGSAKKVEVEISGASKLNLSGKAEVANLEVSGASHFEGSEFQAKEAVVEISGAAKAQINVQKRVSGEVSGASSFTYTGNPDKVILEKSRGASVTHK